MLFCDQSHPGYLLAMLAYGGSDQGGKVTRITIGGVHQCPGGA
jgi:hypothetical protein